MAEEVSDALLSFAAAYRLLSDPDGDVLDVEVAKRAFACLSRSIFNFFFPKKHAHEKRRYKTDRFAHDFVPDWRPNKSTVPELASYANAADAWLTHFTARSVSEKPKWSHAQIMEEVLDTYMTFYGGVEAALRDHFCHPDKLRTALGKPGEL